MKTRRANISGRVSAIWKSDTHPHSSFGGLRPAGAELQRDEEGFSGITVLAVIAVITLITSVMWRSGQTIQATNDYSGVNAKDRGQDAVMAADALAQLRTNTIPLIPEAAQGTAFTDIGAGMVSALLGTFTTLQQNGRYTPQAGEKAAEEIGSSVRPSVPSITYDIESVLPDSDTSSSRVLTYRTDLQTSLKPLLLNDEAEYVIFGRYTETGDKNDLIKLQRYASNYRAAASNAATLVVPADARSVHVALLNALQQFAATLDALSTHTNDPFASAALLVTYNNAEDGVRESFAGLVSYFKQKLL